MRLRTLAILFLAALVSTSVCFAESSLEERCESETYGVKAPAMFSRGLTNILLSPTELGADTYAESKEGPIIIGTLRGILKGGYHMFKRIGNGGYDLVTCWIPGNNGRPLERPTVFEADPRTGYEGSKSE